MVVADEREMEQKSHDANNELVKKDAPTLCFQGQEISREVAREGKSYK